MQPAVALLVLQATTTTLLLLLQRLSQVHLISQR